MDRRSWLWRRKSSSEKSAGVLTTESSGSLSSHSERFSDDQEVLKSWPNGVQSPDVSSKLAAPDGGGSEPTVQELTKQLSVALAAVSAKEELLKQHAKVTEEAVSGWEKADLEVANLKKQLDVATQMNCSQDDRIHQLEEALEECLEQLRQAREEQEERIHAILVQKTRDWDAQKVGLETQMAVLESRLEVEKEEHFSDNYEFEHKLEIMEAENSELWTEMLALSEKLRMETVERKLSTQAAETASKQHLECITKIAKLQAECQGLHIASRKAQSYNDSICRPDFITTDVRVKGLSESSELMLPINKDSWAAALISELDQLKIAKETDPGAYASMDIDIMDDFVEIENRLTAASNHSCTSYFGKKLEDSKLSNTTACPSNSELELAQQRTLEMEEKMKEIQKEKREIEILLTENQEMVRKSSVQTQEAETQLLEMATQLDNARSSKEDSDKAVKLLEEQRKIMESELLQLNSTVEKLQEKLLILEGKLNEEGGLAKQFEQKCQTLEMELSRKHKTNSLRAGAAHELLKIKLDKELAAVGSLKFAECQNTITSISRQLKSLASFEDFMLETESQSITEPFALNNEAARC